MGRVCRNIFFVGKGYELPNLMKSKKTTMTTEQVILQKKAEALNAIRKMHEPRNFESGWGLTSNSWDKSWSEQRDDKVRGIITQLEKDLLELKQKSKGVTTSDAFKVGDTVIYEGYTCMVKKKQGKKCLGVPMPMGWNYFIPNWENVKPV